MPLIKQITPFPETRIGLWKIEESQTFFKDKLLLNAHDYEAMSQINVDSKLLEFLASRFLLRYLLRTDEEHKMKKDEHGKPGLKFSPYHISVSHCKGYAGAIISNLVTPGIDVEPIDGKVVRVVEKFMAPDEIKMVNETVQTEQLILAWSAKEAVYKAYGHKGVSFKDDIKLSAIPDTATGNFTAMLKHNDKKFKYNVYFEKLGAVYMTWAYQEPR